MADDGKWWNSPDIELKVKSKFIVCIAGTFFLPNVKSVTKPSCEVDIKEYKMINHVFRYPGMVKWNPITITFVDMNGNYNDNFDTAELLMQMLNNSGYNIPEEATHNIGNVGTRRHLSAPEKSSTIANAFGTGLYSEADFSQAKSGVQNIKITQLTPDGTINEEWTLVNPLIKGLKFGDLSYDSDDAVEYQLDVAYDYAKFGVE